MAYLGKVYKFEKEENFEEFINAFGLPEEKKNFILNYKPNQKFEKDGDTYTHVLYVNDAEKPVTFKVGEEFESTLKTVIIKNVYTIEGNTVTNVLKFGQNDEIVATIKKEFTDDKMVETITNNRNDLLATRYYSV